MDQLMAWGSVQLNLGVLDPSSEPMFIGDIPITLCKGSSSNCNLRMSRDYTPILHYLQPRVMFAGSEVDFLVSAKYCAW